MQGSQSVAVLVRPSSSIVQLAAEQHELQEPRSAGMWEEHCHCMNRNRNRNCAQCRRLNLARQEEQVDGRCAALSHRPARRHQRQWAIHQSASVSLGRSTPLCIDPALACLILSWFGSLRCPAAYTTTSRCSYTLPHAYEPAARPVCLCFFLHPHPGHAYQRSLCASLCLPQAQQAWLPAPSHPPAHLGTLRPDERHRLLRYYVGTKD